MEKGCAITEKHGESLDPGKVSTNMTNISSLLPVDAIEMLHQLVDGCEIPLQPQHDVPCFIVPSPSDAMFLPPTDHFCLESDRHRYT